MLKELDIEVITFDLDDTLWPCAPAIAGAEKAYNEWIERHFPSVYEQHDAAEILSLRRSLVATNPELKNDVTELRRRATENLLNPFGATTEDVNEVMKVCVDARQNVELYDDVKAALPKLSEAYRLASLTNGNADLAIVGIKQYFEIELAATMALPAKPAPDMFLRAFEMLKVEACNVLHVGDDPVRDVAAARDVGCRTVWVNRGDEWPGGLERADYEVSDLGELLNKVTALHT